MLKFISEILFLELFSLWFVWKVKIFFCSCIISRKIPGRQDRGIQIQTWVLSRPEYKTIFQLYNPMQISPSLRFLSWENYIYLSPIVKKVIGKLSCTVRGFTFFSHPVLWYFCWDTEDGKEMLAVPGILFYHEILFFFELLKFNFSFSWNKNGSVDRFAFVGNILQQKTSWTGKQGKVKIISIGEGRKN